MSPSCGGGIRGGFVKSSSQSSVISLPSLVRVDPEGQQIAFTDFLIGETDLKARFGPHALFGAHERLCLTVKPVWFGAQIVTPLATVTFLHGILIVNVLSD